MTPERVVTMGVTGRDFHTFDTYFRNHPNDHVIAFTAAQIPGVANRVYPLRSTHAYTRSLAGPESENPVSRRLRVRAYDSELFAKMRKYPAEIRKCEKRHRRTHVISVENCDRGRGTPCADSTCQKETRRWQKLSVTS